jgi:ferredoxin
MTQVSHRDLVASGRGPVRIIVDRARCSGIGICESLDPSHFEIGDDGALMLLSDTAADDDDAALEAVRSCPALALSVQPE